jgi:hypothetical protein
MKGPSAASRAISDRNIGMAASRGPGSGRSEPVLTATVTAPVNDATRAARAVRKAVEDRAAAVAVCDQAITAGCGGPAAECLHAEHDQHVFVVTRALMILGLMADPETVRRPPKGFGHPKAAAG